MRKIFLIIAILVGNLFSATFNVSTTPELRTALETAATNGEDDTIILADGTYKTTDDGKGTFIYLSNEANSLTLQGSSAENVTLSGDNQHQILNYQSTYNSPLIIKSISLINANNTADTYPNNSGGAIYSDYMITIENCIINNNYATNGGGFYTKGGGTTSIINSKISNNSATSGGGFYVNLSGYVLVDNSTFEGNQATYGAGFNTFNLSNTTVENSKFIDNNATSGGGGFYANNHDVKVYNSIFLNNNASLFNGGYTTGGGAFYARSIQSSNNLFVNNSSAIAIFDDTDNIVNNSIFYNTGKAIESTDGTIVITANNYINELDINVTSINSNNIYAGINLGFVDEFSDDYNLTFSSDLIDAGINTATNITLPSTDLNGNARIVGGNIDIGPYEFSTTRPTINSLTFIGTTKEFSELTFNTTYTLTLDGRTIQSIEYDYLNDGTWTTMNTHTFNTAGTYTVNVKVTDSEGEYSIRSLSVTIAELAFEDMTDEQKLIKAIDSTYYDQIIAIISAKVTAANTEGITTGESNVTSNPSSYNLITQTASDSLVSLAQTAGYNDGVIAGKQYVQDNLAEFNLVTTTTRDAAVATATTDGIATGQTNVTSNPSSFGLITITDKDAAVATATTEGRQQVILNPSSYGLELKEPLTKASIDALSSGWHNISNPSEITDLSIFDSASIVWVFNNISNSWEAYSSNSTYKTKIQNSSDTTLATKVNAGVGIWVLK